MIRIEAGKYAQEGHEPRDEAVPRPAEDPEEAGEERGADDEADEPALQQVGDEERGRSFVESVLLLEDKGLVDGEREGGQTRDEEEGERKGNGLQDLFEVKGVIFRSYSPWHVRGRALSGERTPDID